MLRSLMAVAVVALACCGVADAAPAPTDAAFRETLRAQMREKFTHGAGELVAAYIQAHPAEYQAFETKVIDDLLNDKLDAAATKTYVAEFSQRVRKQAGEATRAAPDDDVVGVAQAQLAAMRFAAQTNYRVCYELHENHGLTVETAMTVGPQLRGKLGKMTAAQAQAIAAGERAPVVHATPAATDVTAVMETYFKAGGSGDWMKAMGANTTDKMTPAERCQGSIRWLEAIVAQPKPVAARVFLGS